MADATGHELEAEQFRTFALEGHAGAAAQRAAREGYDVRPAVLDAVQAQLPKPDAVAQGDRYEWEERSAPNEKAFALLDNISAAAKAVAHKPACVDPEVSRVLRIQGPWDDGAPPPPKRTGVVVTLTSPVTRKRFLVYYVE